MNEIEICSECGMIHEGKCDCGEDLEKEVEKGVEEY